LDIIEASEGLPLIAGEGDHHDQAGGHGEGKAVHEGRDPHIWLDFEYDERIVDKIVAALTRRDPASADHYRRNGERYQKRLKELDLAYRRKLMHCESKTIVLGSHAAFAYMAQRYGLTQIPLYGVSPDSEPTPKKMAEVIKVAKQYRVRAIYYEELVSDKLAKAIAHEVGATLLILNAGHNLTKAQIESGVTFLSLMDKNLENLAYGLGCQ
jgi:zinc transport system substrate-binding protein